MEKSKKWKEILRIFKEKYPKLKIELKFFKQCFKYKQKNEKICKKSYKIQ